jgi:hypothetical protein
MSTKPVANKVVLIVKTSTGFIKPLNEFGDSLSRGDSEKVYYSVFRETGTSAPIDHDDI